METTLLDAAFRARIGHELMVDPLNPHVDFDKGRLHELKRQGPGLEAREVEDAYRLANRLLDVAVELADRRRGPRNDGSGPNFDARTLAERRPGFSRASYEAALGEGYMLTR